MGGMIIPTYDYLCDLCGWRGEAVYSIHDDSSMTACPRCNPQLVNAGQSTPTTLAAAPREPAPVTIFARKITTQFPGVTHGMVKDTHYNSATGTVVRNDAEFRSELSRQSDEASERNQFAVQFQAIDHRDAGEHLGVTDEGMDSTYAKRKQAGLA